MPLEDADDAPMECLTLEEMRASVEATRRKLAAAGKPAPPISAWGTKPFPGRSHGVRTGKHAKGWQPPKKKKRKKR